MRTREQVERDEKQLRICAEIEAQIECIGRMYPGETLRQIATRLSAKEATKMLQLIDELEIKSREMGALEVQR